MAPESETPFTETELLIAVMRDDSEKMVALVADMMNGELRSLEQSASRLSRLVFKALTDREGPNHTGWGERDAWNPPPLKPYAGPRE